jgi:hypothetical protein
MGNHLDLITLLGSDVYLGETNPEEGIPVGYMTSEELLKEIKNGELFGRSPFTSSHLVAQKLPIYIPPIVSA